MRRARRGHYRCTNFPGSRTWQESDCAAAQSTSCGPMATWLWPLPPTARALSRPIWTLESWSSDSCGRSGHEHCFDIDEFPDTVRRELAAVAAFLHAAERQTRVRPHCFVHEDATTFDQLGGDPFAARDVARNDRAAQSEHGVVGHGYGLCFVLDRDDRRNGAEELFIVGRHARLDVGQHRRRIVRATPFGDLSAEQATRALGQAGLDLGVQVVAQIPTRL